MKTVILTIALLTTNLFAASISLPGRSPTLKYHEQSCSTFLEKQDAVLQALMKSSEAASNSQAATTKDEKLNAISIELKTIKVLKDAQRELAVAISSLYGFAKGIAYSNPAFSKKFEFLSDRAELQSFVYNTCKADETLSVEEAVLKVLLD